MTKKEIRKELKEMRKWHKTGYFNHQAIEYGFYLADGKIKTYIIYAGMGIPETIYNVRYKSIITFRRELTLNDEVEITKEWVDELKEKGLLQ